MAPDVTLVVPCFNEAARLDIAAFQQALRQFPTLHLICVDDGSRDGTRLVLDRLASGAPDRVRVLVFPVNRGKGEAVRQGLRAALERTTAWIGYWDADLSTPLDALADFLAVAETNRQVEVIIGSRVKMLGREIERKAYRHYFGRFFATAASLTLGLPVYDTQCGAKLFRVNALTGTLLDAPFVSRWVFDVELLARYYLRTGPRPGSDSGIYEVALRRWHHKTGSKLHLLDPFRAAADLWLIHRRMRKHRETQSVR